MQIRVVGTANLQQAQSQFAALEAQVAALNAQLAKTAATPVAPAQSMQQMKAMHAAMAANAAAGGMWRAEQVRVNDVIQENIKMLGKQRLGFNEVFGKKNRKMMRETYNEHLRLQKSVLVETRDPSGQIARTLMVPREVHKSWDTLSQRAAFFGNQMKSVGTQTQNWGKNMQWAGRQITVGLGYPLALFAAAAGAMAYQTDELLVDIAKVYDTTANSISGRASDIIAVEKELEQVRSDSWNTAKNAAKEYGMSVTDTLSVTKELAATGFRGEELQAATETIARISRLGDIDPGAAEEAYRALKNVLGETAEEAERSFNYINAIENATSLSTSDFVESIPIALSAIKNMNGGLEDMGTLLVAMKSRGIDANQGANAIKSMMGRLYRPSQKVREEWQELIGIDPKSFVEKGGNVIDILKMIGEATENLEPKTKTQLLAGLFGIYQVSRMNAMVEGLKDVDDASTEVGRSIQVANKSAEELAKTADQEMGRKMQSSSAKLKIAFESVKAELAEMGGPFLDAGTKILEVIEKILKGIGNLPSIIKKIGGGALALAAFAGVGMMLLGIIGNLAGAGMRLVGTMARMIGLFKGGSAATRLLTSEQVAAQKAVLATNTGIVKQTNATNMLTVSMQQLSSALASVATQQAVVASGATAAAARGPVQGSAAAYLRQAEEKKNARAQSYYSMMQARGKAQAEATARATEAAARAERNRAIQMKASAASGALLVGSMVTMASTSNETANNMAKWAMILALVGPMLVGAVQKINDMRKAQTALNATTAAGNAGLLARVGGIMGTGAKGGAIGLAIAGVAAAGATALYFWNKHRRNEKEAAAERERQRKLEIEQQQQLIDSTNNWARAVGETVKEYNNVSNMLDHLKTKQQETIEQQARTYYAAEDGGKGAVDAFGRLDAESQMNRLTEMSTDMIIRSGLKVEEVKSVLRGFLVAAGESIPEANEIIKSLDDTLAGLGKRGVKGLKTMVVQTEAQMELLIEAIREGTDVIADEATHFADVWTQAFKGAADNPATSQALVGMLKSFMSRANSISDEDIKNALQPIIDKQREFFERAPVEVINGVTIPSEQRKQAEETLKFFEELTSSADALKAAVLDGSLAEELNRIKDLGIKNQGFWEVLPLGDKGIEPAMDMVEELNNLWGIGEKEILAQLRALGWIGEEIKSIEDALREPTIVIQLPEKEQVRILQEMTTELAVMQAQLAAMQNNEGLSGIMDMFGGERGMGKSIDEAKEKLKLLLNAMNDQRNFQQGDTYEEALNNFINRVPDVVVNADKVKNALKNIEGDYIVNIKFNRDMLADMQKNAWSDLQSAIADDWMSDFEAQQQAAADAMEARHSAAADAMDRRQDSAMEAFEKRWERKHDRIERFYDRRIERIKRDVEAEKKAEAVRQEIFEREKRRLSRLTEIANARIDINVAMRTGNFDEAAKLQNSLDSTVAGWALDDQKDKNKKASEKRIDKLEKRSDLIKKEKDRALKALKEREQAQRKHLQRVHEMQRNALQRQQAMEKSYLQRSQEMDRRNEQKKIDHFLSRIVTSKKELKRWMDETGLSYERFGKMLKTRGTNWAKYFHDEWIEKIRNAANTIRSDAIWDQLGIGALRRMIRSGSGLEWGEWKSFMKTGKWPDKKQTNHGGGLIGKGGTGRAGVARNVKGEHPSERLVRARTDEFLVRGAATKKNLEALEYLNRTGNLPKPPREGRGGVSDGGGMGGMFDFNPNMTVGLSAVAAQTGNMAMKATYRQVKENKAKHKRQVRMARAAAKAAQGIGNLPIPTNLPDGLNERQRQAFAFANRQITSGSSAWYRACLKFVRMAFGDPGGVATASDAYRMSKNRGAIYGGRPPVGVPVFWPNSGAGHVGISAPGGRVLTNDFGAPGYITSAPSIAAVTDWMGVPYAGWSNWINNTKILSLAKGAKNIKWDNTLANLHKGEAVLTEDINAEFQRGVKNFANGPSNEFAVNFIVHGNVYGVEDINDMADIAVQKIKQRQARLPGSRKG